MRYRQVCWAAIMPMITGACICMCILCSARLQARAAWQACAAAMHNQQYRGVLRILEPEATATACCYSITAYRNNSNEDCIAPKLKC